MTTDADETEGFEPTRGTTDADEAAAQLVIDDLRVKDPDLHLEKIRTPVAGSDRRLLGVIRVVDKGTYDMAGEKDANSDPAQRASVSRLIFNHGVVYPKGAALQKMIKRYPYIVRVWAGEIAEMSGAFKGSEREKV